MPVLQKKTLIPHQVTHYVAVQILTWLVFDERKTKSWRFKKKISKSKSVLFGPTKLKHMYNAELRPESVLPYTDYYIIEMCYFGEGTGDQICKT